MGKVSPRLRLSKIGLSWPWLVRAPPPPQKERESLFSAAFASADGGIVMVLKFGQPCAQDVRPQKKKKKAGRKT